LDADGFTTQDGVAINYGDITFLRKGEIVSVPSMQWSSTSDNVIRLKQMLAEGETVSLVLKVPDSFAATIANRTDEGIFTSDGRFIHFEEIGFVTRKIPVATAFPRMLARDVLLVPAFLLFAFVDLLAIVGMH